MPAVQVSNVFKTFGRKTVVHNVSFVVEPGEIFGLIGPNGAGKTTTIRMMMDIIKPDKGIITILDEIINDNSKNHIGYLPEERGLYRKLKVIDSLLYLASLKNYPITKAISNADELLARVSMLQHKNRKIDELSKGMGQLIQFIATFIHDPRLLIFDEPFSGLDPVNTELIREMIGELKNQGKAVILSTHQMNQVEELCDRVMMIDKGRNVLYGKLAEIKERFRDNSIVIEYEGILGLIDGITNRTDESGYTKLFLDTNSNPKDILNQIVHQGIRINRFEVSTPALNEIFIEVALKNQDG
jgi:ABC-2 type transport system ATP-binding protein